MANRRQFTAEFKAQVVLEVLAGLKTSAEVCREYQLKPQTFSRWRAALLENASAIFERQGQVDPRDERIAELERLIGRLTLELDVAKKASNILQAHLGENETRL
jgi:transposase-like protein